MDTFISCSLLLALAAIAFTVHIDNKIASSIAKVESSWEFKIASSIVEVESSWKSKNLHFVIQAMQDFPDNMVVNQLGCQAFTIFAGYSAPNTQHRPKQLHTPLQSC